MLKLAIYISKYIFVFILAYFHVLNLLYIRAERRNLDKTEPVNGQFCLIMLFHIITFAILGFDSKTGHLRPDILLLGGKFFLFLIAATTVIWFLYKKGCPALWNNVLFLMDAGLVMLARLNPESAEKQLIWLCLGFVTALGVGLIVKYLPYLEALWFLFLSVAAVVIILPFYFGVKMFGAVNWVNIFGFNFQPSEFVKILFIFFLASVLRKKQSVRNIILISAVSALFVLVLVIQKDLGGALIFFITCIVMLYISTGSVLLLIAGTVGAAGASIIAYIMFSHIRVRIHTWLNPWQDADTGGYQILQSLFAMGTKPYFGSGLGLGMPTYIPAAENDFIFAAIAEEFGVLFGIMLVGIFIFILYRGINQALRANGSFHRFLAAGLTSILTFQAFLILGGCIKLIPLTGVTLPFVSYGGSSVLASVIMLGILQRIQLVTEPIFEKPKSLFSAFTHTISEPRPENPMNKNIRRVFWVYFLMLATVIGALTKFAISDAKNIITNPYNPRLKTVEHGIIRGDILDSNMVVMATSKIKNSDAYNARNYPINEKAAHVIGFAEKGKSGVESKYNFQLQRLDMEFLQRISNLFTGSPLTGDSIVLTVDAGLTELIYDKFNGKKGGVVVLEPSTGRVLAMASYPSYDPNKIVEEWSRLSSDNSNSPLLNRATQGLYPPGSVFKLIPAAAAFEFMPEYADFEHDCTGISDFGHQNIIHCFDSKAHGSVNVNSAFKFSCNTYFAELGNMLGVKSLSEIAKKTLFNQPLDFPLEYSVSSFVLDSKSTTHDIVQTSIGQGKTLVSPLHMAMVTSAVANGGILMQPYLREYSLTYGGRIIDRSVPVKYAEMFSLEESEFLKRAMVNVVEGGTGAAVAVPGIKIAAKTGTAENPAGADHGWFVAFAPADKPEVAIAIVLENSDGPKNAISLAKEIINYVCIGK